MGNVLYLILIVGCVIAGWGGLELWTIPALGAAATVLFFLVNPRAAGVGLKEHSVIYPVIMVVGSSVPCAILYGLGPLARHVFAGASWPPHLFDGLLIWRV